MSNRSFAFDALLTSVLPSDMNHTNMYAVGLALCTFADIASEEMSRDLANEIEKLLGSSNTYIRKKVLFKTVFWLMSATYMRNIKGCTMCSQSD